MLVQTAVVVLDDAGNPMWSYRREELVKINPDGEEMVLRGLELVSAFAAESVERIQHQAEGDRREIQKSEGSR